MDILKRLQAVERRYRITFISTLIVGIMAQGMGLFNKFSVRDDICSIFKIGFTVTSGRWGLQILGDLERLLYGGYGHYSMPLFNGLFSILFLAIAAVLIVYLLDIRRDLTCIFVGGILVAFPTITCSFEYFFTAHYYLFALMCGALGSVLICMGNRIWKMAAGILLIAFSIGIYQGFLPTSVLMMFCYLVRVIREERSLPDIFRKIVRVAAGSLLSVLLYLGLTKLSLIITHSQLTSYEGISSMGKASIAEYLSRIKEAYRVFFLPEIGKRYNLYPYHLRHVYLGTILLLAIFWLIFLVRLLRKRKGALAALYALAGFLFPLAVNFIFFLSGGGVYTLMSMGQVFPFIILAWRGEKLIDRGEGILRRETLRKTASILAVFYCALTLVMYIRYDNACYLKTAMVQEEAKSYLTTLITQIKSTEGYRDDLPVAFVNRGKNRDHALTQLPEFDDLILAGSQSLKTTVKDYASIRFMNYWCGFSPNLADARAFHDLPEVKEMPHYPDDGSIKIVNGTVVVKF